jgi:histidyl-tRNA synthetase
VEIPAYPVGSVGGGGRYDKLLGMFTDKEFPAVGFAFGFDRTMEAMDALELFPEDLAQATSKVLVTIFSEDLQTNAIQVSSQFREKNINTEIYLGEIKEKNPLEKQLKYAIQKNIPYVIVLGPEEVKKNIVTLKNIQTHEQQQITIEEAIKLLRH